MYHVLACTCKNTNPKANPNKVIKQQEIATLIISDIELNKIINNCKKLKIKNNLETVTSPNN
jgi:hypothetical protein